MAEYKAVAYVFATSVLALFSLCVGIVILFFIGYAATNDVTVFIDHFLIFLGYVVLLFFLCEATLWSWTQFVFWAEEANEEVWKESRL